MRSRIAVLAASAAMLVSTVFVGPATAAPATWTVTPGGTFTATAVDALLEIQESGIQYSCESVVSVGVAKSGSGLSNPLATISDTTFDSPVSEDIECSGPLGYYLEFHHVGTWTLNGASYDTTTGVTTGAIENVVVDIVGIGCDARITGALDVTYTNSTHQLRVLPNFGLLVSYVNPSSDFNCFGIFHEGEHVRFIQYEGAGSLVDLVFDVSPPLTISMQS